jgi:hypothetical protein
MLIVVLALEWTVPLGGYAEPNEGAAPTASVGTQEVPPMQDAAIIEEPKPFYKTWWFWTLVVFVAAGVVIGVAVNSAVNDPPPPGL